MPGGEVSSLPAWLRLRTHPCHTSRACILRTATQLHTHTHAHTHILQHTPAHTHPNNHRPRFILQSSSFIQSALSLSLHLPCLHPLPYSALMVMPRYRFNARKGQFRVLAGPDCEQALLDSIQRQLGPRLHAIVVAAARVQGRPTLRVQHHTRPRAGLDLDLYWIDQGPGDAEADPHVGDVLIEGVVLPPAAVQLPLWEYQIVLLFKQPFSKRPGDYALRLLNEDPLCPLAAACTPLMACAGEDAVEVLLTDDCLSWGVFMLDHAALVLLLHRRYGSLSDEPAVVKTIKDHLPLEKVADAQHRRDILSAWKKQLPGETERLQERRCDQPLLLPNERPRAPYMVGWDEWMRVNIHHELAKPEHHVMRPLVLIGPPAARMTEWARSHGRHIYMQGRPDLAHLHDCLADADGAQYLVLDELPWSWLLGEEKHCHSMVTNAAFNWFHGSRPVKTTQHLPVIVLKSHLPNPNDPCWAPRGWHHWKSILQIVKLLPHVPLLEAATNTDAPTEQLQGAIAAELLGSIREPRTRAEKRAHLLATSGRAPQDDSAAEEKEEEKTESRAAAEEEKMPGAAPLKVDVTRRVQYGLDSFFYPEPVPLSHRDRLLHVVAAIHYVQMRFRGRDLARQKAFQSDNIAGSYGFYEYTGSVPDAWHLGDWSPEILELRDALRDEVRELIDSVVANQYLDRRAGIDHHSDKTPDIKRGTSIWTVSLGATRVLELRKIVDDGSEPLRVELTHGSIFQIGPLTNAAYTHSILPADHEVGPRYGLTFRTLASRWLHEEEVALRQPARDGEPWLVQKKASRRDEGGQVVLRKDGYPSRRVIHLEPFALADPTHVQEQDIIRLRQVLPTLKRVKPSGAPAEDDAGDGDEHEKKSNRKKKRKVGA